VSDFAAALRRLIDRIGGAEPSSSEKQQAYDEGFAAGLAAARGQEVIGDGPGGVSWQRICEYAEANPQLLSAWEQELADSVLRSLRYGIPPSARQAAKLEWIFIHRFKGTVT
jgi:hypothetical protein